MYVVANEDRRLRGLVHFRAVYQGSPWTGDQCIVVGMFGSFTVITLTR